jgi:hypothetical protein
MAIRRVLARQKLEAYKSVWPINESASKAPEGWPGWPERKKFSLVLTHDVEGKRGLDRVRQLAEMEMEFGFRSSFNFIPEGDYEVPKELRDWLTDNGFEVGIHDLHHDGKLYASREGFEEKAKHINKYVKEWEAVGFRSGFMLHNLNWIQELDVLYDLSTFDTDPFEPQPDAANTIFPFWIPASADDKRSGYVELPYTLPQDSTMFLLFKEKTADIWKKKIAWIAHKGGMALLNLHPDYVSFDTSKSRKTEFSAELYRDFLRHIKSQHEGSYWHVLPKEIAAFSREVKPIRATRNAKNICMLAYTGYESDGRVVRYAQTLVQRGDNVDVVACGGEGESLDKKDVDGVNLFKIQRREKDRTGGAMAHLLPLLVFCA